MCPSFTGAPPSDDLSPVGQAVAAAVTAGNEFGCKVCPPGDEQELVIPGRLVRDLILGVHGELAAPAVRIHGVVIMGDVDLGFREWRGELDLSHCRVNGTIRLEHAVVEGQVVLDHCVVRQIDATYAQIVGPLLFRNAHCAEGLYALAARISGSLNLRESEIWAPEDKPNRCAIELFRARLGDVFMRNARLLGGVYANGMSVDRNIRLQGSEIVSREAIGWETGSDSAAGAVSLVGVNLGGALYVSWRDAGRRNGCIYGGIVLTRLSCASLRVSPSDLALISALDYLDYGRLLGVTPEQWLDRLSAGPTTSLQPFSQFAGYAARIGRSDLERAARIETERRRTGEVPARSVERWRRRVWQWSVDYGYKPGRSLLWLAVVVALGAGLLMLNSDFLVEQRPALSATVRGVRDWPHAVALSIDNLLPFAGLGAARQWSADPRTTFQVVWLVLFVALKFAGWGLAAVGLASVTGIMRRD